MNFEPTPRWSIALLIAAGAAAINVPAATMPIASFLMHLSFALTQSQRAAGANVSGISKKPGGTISGFLHFLAEVTHSVGGTKWVEDFCFG